MSELPKNELISMQHDDCVCQEPDVIMDKLASMSYIAMLSVVSYGMLALSTLFLV